MGLADLEVQEFKMTKQNRDELIISGVLIFFLYIVPVILCMAYAVQSKNTFYSSTAFIPVINILGALFSVGSLVYNFFI